MIFIRNWAVDGLNLEELVNAAWKTLCKHQKRKILEEEESCMNGPLVCSPFSSFWCPLRLTYSVVSNQSRGFRSGGLNTCFTIIMALWTDYLLHPCNPVHLYMPQKPPIHKHTDTTCQTWLAKTESFFMFELWRVV